MTANELIELLNHVPNKDKQIDIFIKVQNGHKPDIAMVDQFSVLVEQYNESD